MMTEYCFHKKGNATLSMKMHKWWDIMAHDSVLVLLIACIESNFIAKLPVVCCGQSHHTAFTCSWIKLLSTDLEDIFSQAGIGRNSLGLTYRSLSEAFGASTPSASIMECFDIDRDQRYSLTELKAALGLWVLALTAANSIGTPSMVWVFCNCCTFFTKYLFYRL